MSEENVKLCNLKHLAFIMDGNGRWAAARGMPRSYGHKAGAETFRKIVRYCGKIGVEVVTAYAFSTENRKRPKSEVEYIIRLLDRYLDEFENSEDEYDFSLRFIGDISILGEKTNEKIKRLVRKTEKRPKILNIAFNYGGRDEIVRAFNILREKGGGEITEKDISDSLYTAGCPDPDMIIRTAGEYRLSNFLLWQASYSEFYFTDKLWPDLGPEDIDEAVKEYGRRKRNFGAVK